MRYCVVVPWWTRAEDPWRCQARERVLEWTEDMRCRIVIGECHSETWSKAEAVADALARTDADLLLLWDADVLCNADAVHRAIEVAASRGWAIPHQGVHRLSREATASYHRTRALPTRGPYDRLPYRGMPAGGLVVVTRQLYDRAPFDVRFRGWGHEDEAAGIAWRTLAGRPWRGNARLYHLWHPPQERLTNAIGSRESYQLLQVYRAAAHPNRIHPVIKEARDGVLALRRQEGEV